MIPRPRGSPSQVSEANASAFRRAILALNGGDCDDRIVRLGTELGRAGHGELVGVHVVEVGWTMPLDADVASRSEEAQQIPILRHKLRLVIVLSGIEGHDTREVAALLDIPEGTVRSRMFLARKALAERLQWLTGNR